MFKTLEYLSFVLSGLSVLWGFFKLTIQHNLGFSIASFILGIFFIVSGGIFYLMALLREYEEEEKKINSL